MKKTIIFFIILVLILLFSLQCSVPGSSRGGGGGGSSNRGGSSSNSPSFLWAKRLGGTANDIGNGITKDSNGNIIIAGRIEGNVDLNGDGDYLDPGESAIGYGDIDIFIVKLDSAGSYLWSKRLGGVDTDGVGDIITDSNDNIIISGHVEGQADLNGDGDKTDAGESFIGYGYEDVIIIKFNSAGSFQWAKKFGGISNDYGNDLDTDSYGNIFITADIYGDADLNGDGDSTDGGAESALNFGFRDIILVKFNASGIYQWAKRLGGADPDEVNGIKVDSENNIVITGWTSGNADWNGDGDYLDTGESGYGNADIIILKFDSAGTYQWAKRLGGSDYDYGQGITIDLNNNIIITGSVRGDADLNGDGDSSDGGAESSIGCYGNFDIFIVKFNSSGIYQWSKRLGGANSDEGYDINSDSNGNAVVIGYINGNADLNSDGDSTDGGAETSTGYGNKDVFIVKYNSGGIHQWSKRLGGTNEDIGLDIQLDSSNNIIATGRVNGNADLNGDGDNIDEGAESATNYGNDDIFIVKFEN